ncbi:MAG: Uma2 family endonuclease [Methylococcaceae bacterium]|nr:Uma2 family endonuclease [Methylococcaceae bacterium]
MIAALNNHDKLSFEQYLIDENERDFKSEFIDGQVVEMTGASENHNNISLNVASLFLTHIRKHSLPCRPYNNDMKVKVNNKNGFYPDVMVVCNNEDSENNYYKTAPKLIIEVLSKSTHRKDKMVKRLHYQNMVSLEEYVLIEQFHCEITVFRKNKGWLPSYYYLGDEITFESLDLTVPVEELYYQVNNEEMQTFLANKQAGNQS